MLMKIKKLFTVVLIFILATSGLVTISFAQTFTDVPEDHPYKDAIEFCQQKGYVVGIDETTFMPDAKLTRAQLAVLWCRILSIRDKNHKFADITQLANYWDNAVIVLNSLGIVKGVSETSFSPDSYITREQLALLTKKTYKLGAEDPDAYKQYTDHESISEWARDGISSCINAEVFEGLFDKENFMPQEPVTRAELCKLVYNLSLPKYTITIAPLEGGTITASHARARAGTLISLDVIPDEGKQLKPGTLKYNDTPIEGNTFIMPPEDVLITAEFEDMPPVLESIEVTSEPDKTTYTVGEALDLTGLVITATYSDGSQAVVTGYTTDPAEGTTLDTEGTVNVVVSYTEGDITVTTSFDVEVTDGEPEPATLESIEVTSGPNKTTYTVGEALDLTGLVITATYSDGSTNAVTGYTTNPVEGEALNTEGTVTVTVSYTEGEITKTATFDVQVNPADTNGNE